MGNGIWSQDEKGGEWKWEQGSPWFRSGLAGFEGLGTTGWKYGENRELSQLALHTSAPEG